MPLILIPNAAGGRKPVKVLPGGSLATQLRRLKVMDAAARFGMEKKTQAGWEKVPTTYILRRGDVIRVRYAAQKSSSGALAKLLKNIVKAFGRKS